jgi:hypothetical protein
MENRKGAQPCQIRKSAAAPASIFRFLLSIFAVTVFVAGCAAPGEPIERKPRAPTPVADLAATQHGNEVALTFTLPKESVDRRPLKQSPTIEIYRGFAPASSGAANTNAAPNPAANPTLLVTIPSAMVDQYDDRGHIRFVDSLKPEDFTQHPGAQALYIVRTRTSPKKTSADSNVSALRIEPAADAITDLQGLVTHQGVVLTWTPPRTTVIGVAPPIIGYRIYRQEAVRASPPTQSVQVLKSNNTSVRIGECVAPPFRDTQIEFGNTYVYTVRSVAQYPDLQIESLDSTFIDVTPQNTFPPDAPQGLLVVLVPTRDSAPAYFDLSWSISPDNDIAGYNIYRTEQDGARGDKLNPQLLLTPSFRDMNVVSGHRYFYTVTAVDRAGNESPASAAASGEMPAAVPD